MRDFNHNDDDDDDDDDDDYVGDDDDDDDDGSEMASNGNGPTAREKFQWGKRAVMTTKLLSFENPDDYDDGEDDDEIKEKI